MHKVMQVSLCQYVSQYNCSEYGRVKLLVVVMHMYIFKIKKN